MQAPSAPASRALLDAIPIFAELTVAEREVLLPHCRVRVYRRGETLFHEGEESTELSFVVLGGVKIVKTAQERSVLIGLLGPGEPIGIVAALERVPYPGTAVAVEPSASATRRSRGGCFGSSCSARPSWQSGSRT